MSERLPSRLAAVVLAAGRATRFGAGADDSKVVAPWRGRPLVAHVVDAAQKAGIGEIVVVTGHAASAVERALADQAVRYARNGEPAAGLASSLALGIAALAGDVAGAFVMLGDMPCVRPETLVAMAQAFLEGNADAVVPEHKGRAGNPALLGAALFPALIMLEGDQGARAILADPETRVRRVAVADPGVTIDVDTRDALMALGD